MACGRWPSISAWRSCGSAIGPGCPVGSSSDTVRPGPKYSGAGGRRLELRHARRRDLVGAVDLAAQQRAREGARVDDELERHGLRLGRVGRVPVAGVLLEHDLVAGAPGLQLEGAAVHDPALGRAERVALGLGVGLLRDGAGDGRHLLVEQLVGLGEGDGDLVGPRRLDRLHVGEEPAVDRLHLRIHVAQQAVRDILGRDGVAVPELHSLADGVDPGRGVRVVPLLRQAGLQLPVRGEPQQVVAHVGDDHVRRVVGGLGVVKRGRLACREVPGEALQVAGGRRGGRLDLDRRAGDHGSRCGARTRGGAAAGPAPGEHGREGHDDERRRDRATRAERLVRDTRSARASHMYSGHRLLLVKAVAARRRARPRRTVPSVIPFV